MSRLYYEHFVFLFFENSLNRPGGEMTGLPRVLAGKFLCFDWEVVAYEIWLCVMNV